MEIIEDLGLTFIPLFVAIDPIGILPFIISLTADMTPSQRLKTLRQSMIAALALGLVFIGIGKSVFFLLNIRMADFLVAGGIILLVLAVRHLMTGKLVEFQPSLGEKAIAVVPIGTPLVVGPAALTALFLLTDQFPLWIVAVSFILNLLLAWLFFSQANRMVRILKREGVGAVSQISSLLLAAIAVMMIRQGFADVLGR